MNPHKQGYGTGVAVGDECWLHHERATASFCMGILVVCIAWETIPITPIKDRNYILIEFIGSLSKVPATDDLSI